MKAMSSKKAKKHDPLRDDMDMKVLLQNRTANFTSETPCSPEMILMNASDMRSLRVKAGSYVSLTNDPSKTKTNLLVFQCWPSSNLMGGCVSLNRVWWPNFGPKFENRTASLSRKTWNLCVLPCKRICFTVQSNSLQDEEEWLHEELQDNMEALIDYVYGYIGGSGGGEGICAVQGSKLGLTWKTRALVLEVHHVSPADPDEESEEGICYRVNQDTSIRLFTLRDEDLEEGTAAARQSQDLMDVNNNSLSTTERLYLKGFASYEAEAKLCVRTTRLGLGLSSFYATPASSALSQMVLKPPKGMLLHGPRGCGKTRLARAVVDMLKDFASGVDAIELDPSLLMGGADDSSNSAVATLTRAFNEAQKRAPCIILLDECEILCQQRAKGPRGEAGDMQRRVLTCLLNLIDGLPPPSGAVETGVFVLACSSRPDLIDSAMRRPGRLDVEIELKVPSVEQRVGILGCVLEQMGVMLTGNRQGSEDEDERETPNASAKGGLSWSHVRMIANKAHGMVGADLLKIAKEAHLCVLDRAFNDREDKERAEKDTDGALSSALGSMSLHDTFVRKKSGAAGYTENGLDSLDLLSAVSAVTPMALNEVAISEIPQVCIW